jgi:Acetyltransferase (GNAT) domain
MTGYAVDVSTWIPDPASWDGVVEASGAPLFYRSDALRAYRRNPLRETLDTFYLTVRSLPGGPVEAVLPAFLMPGNDPLGVLSDLMPGFRPGGAPLLLSHVWHWYDTHLPARHLSPGLVEAVCAALRDVAAASGAQAFGFMNVSYGGRLAGLLVDAGIKVERVDARYVLDLGRFRSIVDYLAGLRPAARQELRRHPRRARDAGAEVTVGAPTKADMAVVAELCRITAAKHGNAGWYTTDRLISFVIEMSRHVRLVAIRQSGRPLAASISFVDGPRFHNWAAGTVPLRELSFSPYLVLLEATIRTALAEGCTLLEGGRRNDRWKERLGLVRQPLLGCLVRT